MTIEEFNTLVSDAYEAAFSYAEELQAVYEMAYARQTGVATRRFESATKTVTAAWTPPVVDTLTDGMNDQEQEDANAVRNQAAEAIAAILLAAGITASSPEFMAAISARAQTNFEQEILRKLRTIVSDSFDAGLSSEATAQAIREQLPQVIPASAQMLAQTELTALVNERSLAAAEKQFRGEVSKTWLTVGDNRVRSAHAAAQGQTVPISQPFQVGGSALMYPGDPNGPLRLVARCRCRLSYTNDPAAVVASARPDVSHLAMVAVYPRPDEAQALAEMGTHPAETMHCTMAFLGDVANIDLEAAGRAVARVARNMAPMSGKVGGVGCFASGEDGTPILAIPNVGGLSELRTRIMDALAVEGVSSPSEHDWVPHMTLDYAEEPGLPDMAVIGTPLSFDTLSLVVADERTDFPLGTLVASAQEDTLMGMELRNEAGEVVGNIAIFPNTSSNNTASTSANYDTLTSGLTVTITETEDDVSEVEDQAEDTAEGGVEEPMPMADGPAWKCLLAVEGVATEDGRYLEPGSLTWRDLPLSLTAMDNSNHGAEGKALVAGRIDEIWRDGNEIWGSGVFNTDEWGTHIYELVSNQSLRGNSVEIATLGFEYRDPETGLALSEEALMDAALNGNPVQFAVTDGVIMASTVCPTPAIAEANIILASGIPLISFYTPWKQEDTLTASAAGMVPLYPPAAWFEKPNLMGPTPLTITPEGQVFGHPALWDSCHIGEPSGPGICVPPPRSGMNYEIFHHGACRTAEGHDVVVGQLTLGTLHAGRDLGWRETIEHYENSGLAFADVHAYEDRFGIVVAGALRPDVPATKVREAKAGALSGDWRSVIGRGLEFLAALVVNVPGFPIPRPEARIVASAAGEEEVLALVAAGMVPPAAEVEGMSRREYLRQIRALTDGVFRTYTEAQRKAMAKKGQALPDGSFPIADCADAENAIRSVGRASDPGAAKAHIRKRVKALGCTGSLFDDWK